MTVNARAVVGTVLACMVLVGGAACSSKTKTTTRRAASGAPQATTTKAPASQPALTTKVGSNVSNNRASSLEIAGVECRDEGLAACSGSTAVYCTSGKLYALDCAAAFGGTCAELNAEIDCIVDIETEE